MRTRVLHSLMIHDAAGQNRVKPSVAKRTLTAPGAQL
jgi:hypothetical protein